MSWPEFKTSNRRLVLLVCACCIPWFHQGVVNAQEVNANPVHWAYSAYFGTGWYSVEGDRDVFVLRMTPRWNYRESAMDDNGKRTIGFHFKFPITVGLDRLEFLDPIDAVDIDNVSSLSINPGIDVEIPVTDRWTLRPFASIGYGSILDGSGSAWTYWAGIKSRFALRPAGRMNWSLINSIGYVGYTPDVGPSDQFWPLVAGFEFDYPLGQPTDGDQLMLYWHTTYTTLENNLDFLDEPDIGRQISDQWEAGVAIGKRDSRLRIWFLRFDRLGIGYRQSSNGDLKGITFLFRSLFES